MWTNQKWSQMCNIFQLLLDLTQQKAVDHGKFPRGTYKLLLILAKNRAVVEARHLTQPELTTSGKRRP
jgi:hypothetical protein